MRSVFYFYKMHSFIFEVLKHLKTTEGELCKLTFILPSKRSGLFLKKELLKIAKSPSFLAEIISIEDFIEELSQLKSLNNLEVLFEFYSVYKELTPKKEIESFDRFSKWAGVALQDFNDIDRHLIPPEKIFKYLSAIEEINHWSLAANSTKMTQGYLKFWEKLHRYYINLSERLLIKNCGYQGLLYRNAVQNLEAYLHQTKRNTHVFIGFNALNAAESLILQALLKHDMAKVFWDADSAFLDKPYHDAGLFMRRYLKEWPYFKTNSLKWISDHYKLPKQVDITAASKQIGQVKYVGELLSDLYDQNNLENTALILADESLLLPILNSLPSELEEVNITMGFPLRLIPLTSFVDQWFKLHSKNVEHFYHKDVIALLSHPFAAVLFSNDSYSVQKIIKDLRRDNQIEVSLKQLLFYAPSQKNAIKLLFDSCKSCSLKAVEHLSKLLFELKTAYEVQAKNNSLALEYIQRFLELFQQIQYYNTTYKIITTVKTLQRVFKELLSKETLDFRGQPLKGLQIMGMLESRVLEFETVIIVSLNEGILPAGKSQNSFIPFDVKLENELPTYKEKDAIYTYHFYRLLHRARNIHLIYNSEAEALNGGEPSRFIAQIELEDYHQCRHQILTPQVQKISTSPYRVRKTKAILKSLENLAKEGFSPSSLGQYIRNPIDFYNQKILGVEDSQDLEETVEATTFGSVVHATLEAFYKPFIGQYLEIEKLTALKPKIGPTVRKFFKLLFRNGDISRGKNLISFEIAKLYVLNFLNLEIQTLKRGHKISLEAVEKSVNVVLVFPEFKHPISLKGNIDRIDICDGVLRIIDYKTSKVEQRNLNLVDWEPLTQDYKTHSKSFQLLMYAYMLNQEKRIETPLEVGIISFKNLKAGILKFTKKDKPGRGAHKQTQISMDLLSAFENQLKLLLGELLDPEKEFIEKEV